MTGHEFGLGAVSLPSLYGNTKETETMAGHGLGLGIGICLFLPSLKAMQEEAETEPVTKKGLQYVNT